MSAVMNAPIQATLFDYEHAIEDALESVDAGWRTIAANLRAIHQQGLYRADYGTWARYCQERWAKGRTWAHYLLKAAEAVENVHRGEQDAPLPQHERQIRPLIGLAPEEQADVWHEAVARHATPTGAQVATIVDERRVADSALCPEVDDLAGVPDNARDEDQTTAPPVQVLATLAPPSTKAALFTSDAQNWNTPAHILDAVIQVLGAIDLDPCSNTGGAPNVPAARHFREADDGLSHEWAGLLYVNPPYDATAAWVEKLIESYEHGAVHAAILLVASRTDTRWFQQLDPYLVCFIRGRLRFSNSENSAPFPSAVFYLGTDQGAFARAFSPYGLLKARYAP